jgi:hypothetical protein
MSAEGIKLQKKKTTGEIKMAIAFGISKLPLFFSEIEMKK